MPKCTTDKPWERQADETPKAYAAFCLYRDLGPSRSYAKVGQELGKSKTLMEKWGSNHGWVKRAIAYDNDLTRIAKTQAEKELKDMTSRHIKIAMQLQTKAVTALSQLHVADMTPKEILAFLTEATKIERMNRIEEAGIEPATKPGAPVGAAAGSSLADVILEAYGKRRRTEDDA
jgi:hypothetical protein